MSHRPRIEGQSLCYFITSEGAKGKQIFKDDNDRQYLINLLRLQKLRSRLTIYAYVILNNKYALIMETSQNNLKTSMHRINSGYANFYNRCHSGGSRLFRDRYSCCVLDKEKYLVEMSRHLHLLPEREGEARSSSRYRWSSFPGYVNEKKRVDWVDYDPILDKFEKSRDETSKNYKKYVNDGLKKDVFSPLNDLASSDLIGSDKFKRKIKGKKIGGAKATRRHEIALARKIKKLVKNISGWSPVFSRNAAIYFIKKYTCLSNQEISTLFNGLGKSSISQMSRRFRGAMEAKVIRNTARELEENIERLIQNK